MKMKLVELLDLFSHRTVYKIRDAKGNVVCECDRENIPFRLLLKDVRFVEAIGENKAHVVLK